MVGVISDRVFALENCATGERIVSILEADRGTMPIERSQREASSLVRMLHWYAAAWWAGIHRQRFAPARFRVLLVTSTPLRAAHLRSATRDHHSATGLFLVTDLDTLLSADDSLRFLFGTPELASAA